MRASRVVTLAATLVALSLPALAADAPVSASGGQALVQVEVEPAADPEPMLAPLLEILAREQEVTARVADARRMEGAPEVVMVPAERAARPEAELVVYVVPERSEVFFLQLETTPSGPEARLWGVGPSEILITTEGITLLPAPSEATFRLSAPGVAEDTLACIARTLGLTINTTNLQSLLSSAACAATNTIILTLTASNCLSFFTPAGFIGCTVGIAKIVSCSIANCGTSGPPGGCRGTIALQQRLTGAWTTDCAAPHRSGRYAKLYTFTLTATTALQIDLDSSVDPYLILLRGDETSGTIVASDDDGGPGWSSRISGTFPSGTYTIEATTYSSRRTGSFTLALSRR